MTCACGHDRTDHANDAGRCHGVCHDSEYGTYNCVCPYYTEEKL